MPGAHGTTRALTTVAWLRDRIASGEWPINSRIPTEPQLVEAIGVGRSTVREAVRTLANQGMLETAPGRGTFVRARTPVNSLVADYLGSHRHADVLQVRRGLEVEAAGLAAELRTDAAIDALEALLETQGGEHPAAGGDTPGDFHSDVFAMAGNELLADLYRGVISALRTAISRGQLVLGDREMRHEHHVALARMIRDRDVAGARRVAFEHCSSDIRLPRRQ